MTRKRPTGVIIVSILHIYLSLFLTLIGLFALLLVYIGDYWSQFWDSMFPPWFYPGYFILKNEETISEMLEIDAVPYCRGNRCIIDIVSTP